MSSGVRRSIIGNMQYTSMQAHRPGAERGRESFRMDVHRDGSRVLSAHSEIDDAPAVVRDIDLRLDPDNKPRDCFVRIAVGGQFRGAGWFCFDGLQASCESSTTVEGRISQRFDLDRPLAAFGNHAMVSDAYATSLYDRSRGPGRQVIRQMLLSSPDHRGATGPMIFPVDLTVEYVGETEVDVIAGRFNAFHFRFVDTRPAPEGHPDLDMWMTADGDFVLLRATVGGYLQNAYELTNYTLLEY